MPGRLERFRGALANDVHYTLARPHDRRDDIDAIAGLLVTYSHIDDDFTKEEPDTDDLEIVEFDVAKSERGTGLGRTLLQHVMAGVGDGISMVLNVAAPNEQAIAIYRHYGFEMYGDPVRHGVFDVEHLPMRTSSEDLKRKLNVTSKF